MIDSAGPLPRFEGFSLPAHLNTVTPAPLAPQQTGTFSNLPQSAALITPEEKARYSRLFNSSGPVMGLLDGT